MAKRCVAFLEALICCMFIALSPAASQRRGLMEKQLRGYDPLVL